MLQHFFSFKHPTTIMIVGPTQAGKTEFVLKLLKHRDTLFSPPPETILWAYGHKNENQIKKIAHIAPETEFTEGLPDLSHIDANQNNLVIGDDLMEEIGNSKSFANLYTRGSHHDNITVIALVHNLFNQQRLFQNASISTRYFILFNSPRDNNQIQHFGRQLFPQHKNFLLSAFKQATEKPYGYLIIDLHPKTPDHLRICTGIFPNEIPRIFVPDNTQSYI
jgi:hypothetical protein